MPSGYEILQAHPRQSALRGLYLSVAEVEQSLPRSRVLFRASLRVLHLSEGHMRVGQVARIRETHGGHLGHCLSACTVAPFRGDKALTTDEPRPRQPDKFLREKGVV